VESVAALQRAGKELGVDWMKWHVAEAKNVGLRREWQPVAPSYVLALADEGGSPATRQVGYRVAAALAVLVSFLGSLLVPNPLSGPDRAFLTAGIALTALALLEKANKERSLWLPLWMILSLVDVVGYLMFHFFKGW
jgi:hypothetical protein